VVTIARLSNGEVRVKKGTSLISGREGAGIDDFYENWHSTGAILFLTQIHWLRTVRAMSVVRISWYLCALFIFALVAESAATVAPAGEAMQSMLMVAWAALAVVFAVVAVTFMWLGVAEPKWLVRTLLAVALTATVTVVLMAVG
jgi:hypothetical protein